MAWSDSQDFGFPKLFGYDDELMVVEMDLMQHPPFIIDFAKVRLNNPPEFSEETLADLEEQGRELFEDNWPAAKVLMEAESFLIFYLDPKPYNIGFRPKASDHNRSHLRPVRQPAITIPPL